LCQGRFAEYPDAGKAWILVVPCIRGEEGKGERQRRGVQGSAKEECSPPLGCENAPTLSGSDINPLERTPPHAARSSDQDFLVPRLFRRQAHDKPILPLFLYAGGDEKATACGRMSFFAPFCPFVSLYFPLRMWHFFGQMETTSFPRSFPAVRIDMRRGENDNKRRAEAHTPARGETYVDRKDVLDSWKEISAYLERDVKTCQRWEKRLGLPVHRYDEDSTRSKVFAYKSEIDRWMETRARERIREGALSPWRKWKAAGSIGLGIVALAVFAVLFSLKKLPFLGTPVTSIAVAPFQNSSSSGLDDYLSEGFTREIIDGLARLSGVRVLPGLREIQADGRNADQEEVPSPDYTLEGSLRREEGNFRVRVQLVRELDHERVWANIYEGKPSDLVFIQERMFQDILERLKTETGKRLENRFTTGKTRDREAFDSYMRGRYLLDHSDAREGDAWKLYHEGKFYSGKWTREHNELAVSLFHRAISLDEGFSLAYLGLAQCYANNVNFNWDYDREWLDKAEELARTAQNLSPGLPEYYTTLAGIYILKDLDFGEGTREKAFETALEGVKKYPQHSRINSIAGYCYFARYGEEGKEEDFRKALEYKEKSFYLDPQGLHNLVFSELLMLDGQFERAAGVCRIIEPFDSSSFVTFRMGEIYYYMGDLEKSRAVFQGLDMPLYLRIHSLLYLGMIAAQEGRKEEALQMVREVETLKPEEYRDFFDELRLGSIYMGIGDKESGYACLESAFRNPFARKDHFIRRKYIAIDGNFTSCREEPRFLEVLEGENAWHGAKEYP